jgi:hypothetical protein
MFVRLFVKRRRVRWGLKRQVILDATCGLWIHAHRAVVLVQWRTPTKAEARRWRERHVPSWASSASLAIPSAYPNGGKS